MTTIDQTPRKDDTAQGFTGLFKSGVQMGLGVAEYMHQAAVEIPLNMLPVIGVSDEQTTALKDKHRNLLRGMYGSIGSVTSQFVEVGKKQAGLLAAGISKLAEDERPVEKVSQATGQEE
jgi:hypothetical protein